MNDSHSGADRTLPDNEGTFAGDQRGVTDLDASHIGNCIQATSLALAGNAQISGTSSNLRSRLEHDERDEYDGTDKYSHPSARFMNDLIPRVQKTAVITTSAPMTTGSDICSAPGVSAARIPSATYTSGLMSTAYFITGTALNPCHG